MRESAGLARVLQVNGYGYYRCTGNDLRREEGITVCTNKPARADRIEAAVWREVRALLREPGQLQQEYERRLRDGAERGGGEEMADHESQLLCRSARRALRPASWLPGNFPWRGINVMLPTGPSRLGRGWSEFSNWLRRAMDTTANVRNGEY